MRSHVLARLAAHDMPGLVHRSLDQPVASAPSSTITAMAFSEHERAANHAALKWFLARHQPPDHVRAQLDFGYAIVGQTVDLQEIRPDWRDKAVTRQRPFARIKYIRAQDEWRLYWKRADLKWHLYEPAPLHGSLQDALAVVDEDHHGCFFG